jgi:hypothetical protein
MAPACRRHQDAVHAGGFSAETSLNIGFDELVSMHAGLLYDAPLPVLARSASTGLPVEATTRFFTYLDGRRSDLAAVSRQSWAEHRTSSTKLDACLVCMLAQRISDSIYSHTRSRAHVTFRACASRRADEVR